MPAIIDHEARRRELADIAADIVAEEGLDAATVRRVAEAAGASTKVVSHYFADKRALLIATYHAAAAQAHRLADASHPPGRADVRAQVLSLLPTRPAMERAWKVWFAFWGHAIADADFAAAQRAQAKRARAIIVEAMEGDARFARLTPSAREQGAREVLTLIIGIAQQAAFDPEDWPARRQIRLIDDALARIVMRK